MPTDDGTFTLTAREVITLLFWVETGVPQDASAARTYLPEDYPENVGLLRARQIRSKLLTKMRGAAGTGPHGPKVHEAYTTVIGPQNINYRETLRKRT